MKLFHRFNKSVSNRAVFILRHDTETEQGVVYYIITSGFFRSWYGKQRDINVPNSKLLEKITAVTKEFVRFSHVDYANGSLINWAVGSVMPDVQIGTVRKEKFNLKPVFILLDKRHVVLHHKEHCMFFTEHQLSQVLSTKITFRFTNVDAA